ncbi:MAG: NUDIX domain-containing protein [bacterium]|nr:NUDIX domain-containing protein [bacterium]
MQPLCTGQRKTGETRAFYPRDTLPPDELCLCVSGIIFLGDSVLLTQNQRGWEIPGGHREPGEDIEETFVREMQEEIGTDPSSITYRRRGVREVSLPRPIPNRTGGFYPPTYYLVQYIGITTRQPTQPTGEEIIGSKGFTRTEIKNSDLKVRELLLYAFKLRESFD